MDLTLAQALTSQVGMNVCLVLNGLILVLAAADSLYERIAQS